VAYPVDYTPSQAQIFRAVAGAVKNAADGHKDWKITKVMAQSIAKRATGTLTANWPVVLAAVEPSEKVLGVAAGRTSGPVSLAKPCHGVEARRGTPLRTALRAERRSLLHTLRTLHNSLGCLAGEARRAGNIERHQALVDCLRLIAEQQNRVK
jgi:hypothetical protein